jgi:hypothetical protein
MKLKINPTFQAVLPPQTDDELQRLEKQLLAEGIREPIVYWQETGDILDGHTRYKIAQKKDLPYTTKRLSFATEEEAMEWIINNQLARRNLTDEQRMYFIGKKYLAAKETHGGDHPKATVQNEQLPKSTQPTRDKVAAETGVSPSTVYRAAAFAQAVDAAPKEDRAAILAGTQEPPPPATKQRKPRKGKQGSERFKLRDWERDWGRMLRWIDELARGYDLVTRGGATKETPEIQGLQRQLKEHKKAFLDLQRDLEKQFHTKDKDK